jgi:hypothetical protein
MNETREQLIARLKEAWKTVLLDPSVVEDYYDEIERHVFALQWRKVSYSLPPDPPNGEYGAWIVYRPNGVEKMGVITTRPSWWFADDDSSARITHWMPLPAKPEE